MGGIVGDLSGGWEKIVVLSKYKGSNLLNWVQYRREPKPVLQKLPQTEQAHVSRPKATIIHCSKNATHPLLDQNTFLYLQ